MSEHEEFQIELGQSVRRHIEDKRSPLEDSSLCALPYGSPGDDQIPVFVDEGVMRSIEGHVLRDKDREVGGVLLGGFYRNDKGSHVEVTDFIAAESAKGTDVSLTFTHETWEQIGAEQARRDPKSQIVGWYHSHPALGVFMSREDEFIHSGFFADPSQMAMVVDPIYHNWGCFKWKDGVLERTGGFYVFGAKKAAKRVREYVRKVESSRREPSRAASATADRRMGPAPATVAPLWIAVAVVLLVQIATGFLMYRQRHATNKSLDRLQTAVGLLAVSDLSGGAEYLRQELVEHPDNGRAYDELARVHEIMSDPEISVVEGERMDEANLMLAMADKMAAGEADYKRDSDFEGIVRSEPQDGAKSMKLEAADPVAAAYGVYAREAVQKSYENRLRRARLVKRLAEGLFEPPSASDAAREAYEKSAWYNRALDWLSDEKYRRIAYGYAAGNEMAKKEFDGLPKDAKSRVNEIRARLGKNR